MNLFKHTDSLLIPARGHHHLLNVNVVDRILIHFVTAPLFSADCKFSLPASMAPFPMQVPDPLHAKAQPGLELNFFTLAIEGKQGDLSPTCAPRSRNKTQRVFAARQVLRRWIFGLGDVVRVVVNWADHSVEVPLHRVFVLKHTHVRTTILPMQRRPQKEDASRLVGRCPGRCRVAHRTGPPAAILRAVHPGWINRH